jgi:ABC-type transport system substrate-binding protein
MENNYWTRTLSQRLSRRRALAAGGAGALGAAFLAACGGDKGDSGGAGAQKDSSGLVFKPTDTTKQAAKGGIMQSAYAVEQLHFDPLSTNSQFTFGHAGHAYQKLLSLKPGTFENAPTGEVDGEIASSWEIAPDGMQLTLKLRPGNKWDQRPPTNSRVINSDDVKWSWNRYLELSPGRTAISNAHHPDAPVKSMEFPDANTVVIKLAFPMGAIAKMFATIFYFFVLPVEADGKFDTKQDMRGSGAWMLTKYEPSVGWEYRRNPNWYKAADRPFLDGINYALIPDYQQAGPQALSQLKAKRLWQMPNTSISADLVLTVKRENNDLQMLPVSPFIGNGSQTYVGMSKLPDSKWEKDVRLRQALSMLIDREAWLGAIQNVEGFRKEGLPIEVGINSHVPSTWAGVWLDPRGKEFGPNAKYLGWDPAAGASVLNDGVKRNEYNKTEAAKLLRAAGQFGAEDTLTFAQQGQFGNEKQLSIFVQMWNEGGHFKIKLNPSDYTTVITPKYTFGHAQYPDLGTHPLGGWVDWDLPLWNTFSPSGRNDYVGHDTPALKELMVKHRQELDPKKRVVIAEDWQRAVAKEMVIVPFPGNATSFSLAWPWLSNWGWYVVAGGGTAQQETVPNWWYDKSKDTRA